MWWFPCVCCGDSRNVLVPALSDICFFSFSVWSKNIPVTLSSEKALAPHSSTLAWKISWTEEPGRLQSMGSAKSQTWLSDLTFTFHFHALEKAMAPHSNVLAWRIPATREPGGLPSTGSHRVGHDWSDLAATTLSWSVLTFSFLQPEVLMDLPVL